MEELVSRGLIRHWGVSNLDTADMQELAAVPNGTHCVTDQVLYHLASRGVEYDLLPWLEARHMTAMAYCPLAQYGDLDRGLIGNRGLTAVARRYNASAAQILLAFTLLREYVIPIPKSSSPAHTEDNAKALAIELTAEDVAELSAIIPPRPAKPGSTSYNLVLKEIRAPSGHGFLFNTNSTTSRELSTLSCIKTRHAPSG